MSCPCKNKNAKKFKVRLPGGLTITKNTQDAAVAFAAKHPGSTVIMPA